MTMTANITFELPDETFVEFSDYLEDLKRNEDKKDGYRESDAAWDELIDAAAGYYPDDPARAAELAARVQMEFAAYFFGKIYGEFPITEKSKYQF
jgi:hypothetical protein